MANLRIQLLLALALMLLAPSAHALTANSSAISSFASAAIPANQSYSVQQFPFSGSQDYAVISGSVVYGIFASGVPILEDTPLTAPDELESALSAYYISQGYSSNISFSDIHAGIASVASNREKGEAACRVLLGTDRIPCTDFESCQRACYSVTSFCQPVALGAGRVFINEIWKFENSSRLLTEAYLNESLAYNALSGGVTPAGANAYLGSLVEVNRAATAASKNALFDGYSYCFAPDYALPVITNMELAAQKRYAGAAPFFTLPDDAMQVRQRTNAALANEASQQADSQAAADARAAANSSSAQASNSSSQSDRDAPAPAVSQGATALYIAAGIGLVALLGFAIIFIYLKSKKKGL